MRARLPILRHIALDLAGADGRDLELLYVDLLLLENFFVSRSQSYRKKIFILIDGLSLAEFADGCRRIYQPIVTSPSILLTIKNANTRKKNAVVGFDSVLCYLISVVAVSSGVCHVVLIKSVSGRPNHNERKS